MVSSMCHLYKSPKVSYTQYSDMEEGLQCNDDDDIINGKVENPVKSIELPSEEMFRNLCNAKRFAIDIGGSLAKLAYLSEVSHIRTRHYSLSGSELQEPSCQHVYEVREQKELGTRLHFIKFETKYIEMCLNFIQKNLLQYGSKIQDKVIKATGGGAYKYKNLLSNKLGMSVDKLDEMSCLIKGCNFLLKNIPNECFQYSRTDDGRPKYIFRNPDRQTLYPYLLVNIGSGVSIVKVVGENKFERIGGTSTGGGTFWGLGSLLTNAKGFDELLGLATSGQGQNVDMLVKDIYGGAYTALNLPAELTASSFGKAARSSMDMPSNSRFSSADIAKSLLHMISNDIGQISSLYAQLHNLKRIFFGGFFIRGHPVTMHTISYAVNFFSKGNQQALFLRHEGYLGAIGAFLTGAEENAVQLNGGEVSWAENYAGSSGLSPIDQYKRFPGMFDVLELDQYQHSLAPCPLLSSPEDYSPDLEKLATDEAARSHWLQHFRDGIDMFYKQAVRSQSGVADAEERGQKFRAKFLSRLDSLREQPYAFGELTVRSLLDVREHFLNEYWFSDPYLQIKQEENEQALLVFPSRIAYLDEMDVTSRRIELVEGMLAGNVFDWGSAEVVRHMESSHLDFSVAKKLIGARPWLQDDLDLWLRRLQGPPHSLAVIFVDNSGGDIILGVFPFVRELLKSGTKVILAANSYPAINDVIHSELVIVAERVAERCAIISESLMNQKLTIMETGVGSPCLDLRRIDLSLREKMIEADLLVLEGMGRSIHTNYRAKFNCETIKMAVLKNAYVAKKFGGKVFDIVFKYETPGEASCSRAVCNSQR